MEFADFPKDIQLNILSFLTPSEISAFACTSRHFSALSTSPSLFLSLCRRRWAHKTTLSSWNQPYPRLYKTLDSWDPLIGFWRQIGTCQSLVLFEWGPNCITGYKIFPSKEPACYDVLKVPFLWLGVNRNGEAVSYLSVDVPVPVSVSFMGEKHMVVQESNCGNEGDDDFSIEGRTEEEEITLEVYRYFANRTSPGGEKGLRKQRRKRNEKSKWWEAAHFVKIADACPTPTRPLQGLWKGICENMNLDLFQVTYDDVGGIACRRVGDSGEPFSGYSPVFWTSNPTFINSPFSKEEGDIYNSRRHICSNHHGDVENGDVSRMLFINSSYDLVLPNMSSSGNPRSAEGRIWEYGNGTFGFGFLRDDFIVDLKHIAANGFLLNSYDCGGGSSRYDYGGSSSSL